jgi:hypothetical protein
MAEQRKKGGNGRGRNKGKPCSEAELAARRANATLPRLRLTKDEQAIRAEARKSMVEFIAGTQVPKLQRMLRKERDPIVWARLMALACDKFGFPTVSEQDIRMTSQVMPKVVIERVGFPKPGEAVAAAKVNGNGVAH